MARFSLILILIVRAFCILPKGVDPLIINQITKQVLKKEQIFAGRFPEYTVEGKWIFRDQPNWLSGFLGGELWYLYEMTGNAELKKQALYQADRLCEYSALDNTHDMGFMFLPTCVKAWQLTGEKKYRRAALQAAEMLLKRFNAQGQYLRAWGKLGTADRAGLMIIDTMMNLELLFWAYRETGDYRFYEAAYRHALTTWRESIRADGSSYHVVEFDPVNGKVLRKFTHQGAADESTWSRGQAWAIYGFARAYFHTKDERFFKAACTLADYFLSSLPENKIPYWDLSLTGSAIPRDASAAAIAASGLLELAKVSTHKMLTDKYRKFAEEIIKTLEQEYLFIQSNRQEEGVLLHTVYHYHKSWGVDESFPAGDYFFIEALYKAWQDWCNLNFIQDIPQRQIYNLNTGWYYLEEAIPNIEHLHLAKQEWLKVNLPHTWNAFDAVDNIPGYRRDISWYQKQIFIPKLSQKQRLLLHFEGVNISCTVYCNCQIAGGHIGGYLGFDVDLTPYIRSDTLNEILIKVDNTVNPNVIPSQKSDFVIYGGIPRDVRLLVLPATFIDRVQISTPAVSHAMAQTEVKIYLKNHATKQYPLTIEVTLKSPTGKTVCAVEQKVVVNDLYSDLKIKLPAIKKPELWSPSSPQLYTVSVALKDGPRVLDTLAERFGYRWFEFQEHGPFYLNGERLLLRGTHRHEDWAGLGNALPDTLHRKDMAMIKAMGANFVRLAHYPQDPEVYQACDELGLLVWDELPWCRGGMGGELWKQNTKRLLQEMITQNYNHPSIIMWSLGNELDWLPDTIGGDNVDSLCAFLTELNTFVHQLDPTRVTATRKFFAAADIVDVFSPSIWSGWYSGVYHNYAKALNDSRIKYRRFFHAEYGGDSHVGRHTEHPITGDGLINPDVFEEAVVQVQVKNIAQNGDWSENYIVDLFDWYLHVSENLEWFTGNAQWALKDFPTPLRPENPIPFINQKGLLDRSGQPKDAYYVFKSYWTTKPEFCYIESHTWTERQGAPGQTRELCVYSNCQSVELFLNGKSQGRKRREINKYPACGLQWQVEFTPGLNQVKAIGYGLNGVTCSDSIAINYSAQKAGLPDRIELTAKRLRNGNYLIVATVVDVDGHRCLDYNRRIYFAYSGSGKLLVDYGTPTRSQIIEAANGRAAVEFVPVPGEPALIEARNQDFKGSYLRLNP